MASEKLAVDFEKRLGSFHLRPHFEAADELIVLLGPSGSGKSQTLRAIAGLLRPDAGRIELPERVAFDASRGIDVAPQARNVGYVVQELALFPHLSVAENMGFALQTWSAAARRERLTELIELLGLDGLGERLPRSISGGQQQRVALGRALAARPHVLLLDEPFSAVDTPVRTVLRREVTRLQRQLGLTAIFVTHDLQEAFALADRIAVYDDGEVLQFDTKAAVFQRPASARVAELLDARNVIEGEVVASTEAYVALRTAWFGARTGPEPRLRPGDRAALSIRPEHVIMLRRDRPHGNELDTTLDVQIVDDVESGTSHRLYLMVEGEAGPTGCIIEADVPSHPYEVMGIAMRRDWRCALSLERTVALPI